MISIRLLICFGVVLSAAAGVASPDAVFSKLAEEAAERDISVVKGEDGWLFLASELRHLGVGRFWGAAAETASRASRPDARDPLPPILAFHDDLKALGVKLVIAPAPPKARVLREMLPGVDKEEIRQSGPPDYKAFYDVLREHGITVLDMTDAFRDVEDDDSFYCRQDSHWSGTGCVKAAKIIAEHVTPVLEGVDRKTFDYEWRTIEITGDLWRMLDDPVLPREQVRTRMVRDADPDPDSPVVLLGDSHTLVFHAGGDMHCRAAGLPEQLALELGLPVDLIGVRGSGATPARINLFRRAQRNPDFWADKKVVIWVFAVREFTESDGWRKVPVAP